MEVMEQIMRSSIPDKDRPEYLEEQLRDELPLEEPTPWEVLRERVERWAGRTQLEVVR